MPGIHKSIGSRVIAMANRVGITEPVMMTGGVAKNIGVVHALEKKSGKPIRVSVNAQVNGAIGAALDRCRYRLTTSAVYWSIDSPNIATFSNDFY